MQDHNTLLFDSMRMSDEELSSLGEKIDKLTQVDSDKIFDDLGKGNDVDVKINTNPLKTKNPVKDDIEEYKQTTKDKEKAALFDYLFSNETQAYFDEHKHVMPSKEKRRLKSILIKKISRGDIYINKVGKIVIRKGKNK